MTCIMTRRTNLLMLLNSNVRILIYSPTAHNVGLVGDYL